MSAPTAIVNHGLSDGDESQEPALTATDPGEWDELTRFYHVNNANPISGIAGIKAIHAADGTFTQMYARRYRIIETSGSWHIVAVDFRGRLVTTDDKKLRKFLTDTWSATRENITYSNVAGADVHSGGGSGSWSTEAAGTGSGAKVEMTHANLVLEDQYLSTSKPDGSEVGWEDAPPDSDPYSVGNSKVPINPWWSLTDPTIKWPYGWVLDSRQAEDVGNGSLFRYTDRHVFKHKVNP